MTNDRPTSNNVRQLRTNLGLTQAELADQAGVSRTAVTAIEGSRLVPSVAAALALAKALSTTVEQLFGHPSSVDRTEILAWKPVSHGTAFWRAEVNGRIVSYPANSVPSISLPADPAADRVGRNSSALSSETLVIACCDPAAGLLASHFAATTGMRMIVLPRSSRAAIGMLKEGLVHIAGLHLSTHDEPDQNAVEIRSTLGVGFHAIRMARWKEGIVLSPSANFRTVRAAVKSKLNWVGREAGSGARQCLDRLLENRSIPNRTASDHRTVVEAVRSGWADAGVCVELASTEAGLKFLPVQEESFDICFSSALADDRRIKAFLKLVRSVAYRKSLAEMTGYDMSETGELCVGCK